MDVERRYKTYFVFFVVVAIFFIGLWYLPIKERLSQTVLNLALFCAGLSLFSAFMMKHVLHRYKSLDKSTRKHFNAIDRIANENKLVKMKEIHFYILIVIISALLTTYTYQRYSIPLAIGIVILVIMVLFLLQYGRSILASIKYYSRHKDTFHSK